MRLDGFTRETKREFMNHKLLVTLRNSWDSTECVLRFDYKWYVWTYPYAIEDDSFLHFLLQEEELDPEVASIIRGETERRCEEIIDEFADTFGYDRRDIKRRLIPMIPIWPTRTPTPREEIMRIPEPNITTAWATAIWDAAMPRSNVIFMTAEEYEEKKQANELDRNVLYLVYNN